MRAIEDGYGERALTVTWQEAMRGLAAQDGSNDPWRQCHTLITSRRSKGQ